MTAIFKREFKSYFTSPIGFIFLAAVYFFLGLHFADLYSNGQPQIHLLIAKMSSIMLYLVPILTMKIISADKKQRIDQLLLTSPVKLISIALGKFLAALSVFAISLAPTIIFELIFISKAKEASIAIPFSYYAYSLFGMLLLGSALIAIGMFISSLFESTAISAIVTFCINVLISFFPLFAQAVGVNWIAKVFTFLSFSDRFESFSANIFSFADIFYFLSLIAVFLFLSVRSLEKKSWA